MKVTGAATLNQPARAVWAALIDPEALARAIPGCERLDATGRGACRLTVTLPIAAVAGTYAGEAVALRRNPPELLAVTVCASGQRGSVRADVTVRLADAGAGGTEVGYEADIRAEGPIAGIGGLVLTSAARRLAADFLGALEAGLAAPAGAPAGPPAAMPAGPVAAVPPGAAAGAQAEDETAALLDDEVRAGRAVERVLRGLLLAGAAGLAGTVIGIRIGAALSRRRTGAGSRR